MFCEDLRYQAIKIINYEEKEIKPLSNEEKESYENQSVCYICEKQLIHNKKYCKVRDYTNCNLRYRIPKEIPIVFHNDSTYNYLFIIKQLAIEIKGRFDC